MSNDSSPVPDDQNEYREPEKPDMVSRLTEEAMFLDRKRLFYNQLRTELAGYPSDAWCRITISRSGHLVWTILFRLEGYLLYFVTPMKYAGRPDDKKLYDQETRFVLTPHGELLVQPEHIDQMLVRIEREDNVLPGSLPHQQALDALVANFRTFFGLRVAPPEGEEWHWRTFMGKCGDVAVEIVH